MTADRKMEYQQRLSGRSFGVVVLASGGTKLEDFRPMADAIREAVVNDRCFSIKNTSLASLANDTYEAGNTRPYQTFVANLWTALNFCSLAELVEWEAATQVLED